jgi:ubiquinone/menaquinone biosynthesis C-methylase UbiE
MQDKKWQTTWLVATAYDLVIQSPLANAAGYALWGADIRKMRASLRRLQAVAAYAKVLDVPCGGGICFGELPTWRNLNYVALDFSPVMLERAAARAARLGLRDIQFQQGDVLALPFSDGSMDLCLCYNGLHCFPDPQKAVAEMVRILNSGGIIRGTVIARNQGARYDWLFSRFQARGYFGPGCSAQQLRNWLTESGCELIDFQTSGAMVLFEARKG